MVSHLIRDETIWCWRMHDCCPFKRKDRAPPLCRWITSLKIVLYTVESMELCVLMKSDINWSLGGAVQQPVFCLDRRSLIPRCSFRLRYMPNHIITCLMVWFITKPLLTSYEGNLKPGDFVCHQCLVIKVDDNLSQKFGINLPILKSVLNGFQLSSRHEISRVSLSKTLSWTRS